MLVLTRRIGETIVIAGDIRVTVVSVQGDKVRLGIAAPAAVPVHRQEVIERERSASAVDFQAVPPPDPLEMTPPPAPARWERLDAVREPNDTAR